jgi:hypothetical protein
MNDQNKPARLKQKWLNLCVPSLREGQLLRARNVNLSALILELSNINLAHPELIEVPLGVSLS